MKSLCIRSLIEGEIHELYDLSDDNFLNDQKFKNFPWGIKFVNYPYKVYPSQNDDILNWWWLPVISKL